MPFAAVCASHAPLILEDQTPAPQRDLFLSHMRAAGDWIRAFAPDLIIEFAPDHFNGFFYDLMPNFCVGLAAESIGDWRTGRGPLIVPTDLALGACEAVRTAGVDVDLSYQMKVDHGFTQLLELMLGRIDAYPVIPVMINCAAPPRPAFQRVRLLGEAVGHFARAYGQRVLFVGSGGLSHDPPMPQIEGAVGTVREAIINGRNSSAHDRESRENRVVKAALDFVANRGVSRPPDAAWDQAFLGLLKKKTLAEVDHWSEQTVTIAAGCGGHEVRTWIAAFAALDAASGGDYQSELEFYEVVPEWITGMGIIRAR